MGRPVNLRNVIILLSFQKFFSIKSILLEDFPKSIFKTDNVRFKASTSFMQILEWSYTGYVSSQKKYILAEMKDLRALTHFWVIASVMKYGDM